MFTWICPKCKREVPPSYTECPDCARQAAGAPADAPADDAPVAPAPAAPPPQVRYAPPVPQGGLPTWLMAILFAGAFGAVGAGIYWVVGNRGDSGPSRPAAAVESPAAKP